MSALVQPIFQPNTEAMFQHLEHLFGGFLDGYHEGRIELAWTDSRPDAEGRYRLKNAEWFGTDQFEELVARAVQLNSTPMCNVYIGAALRKPDTPPFGRSKDEDAWALTCLYADLDDPGATAQVKDIYGSMKPTMVVITGTEPHKRAQLWWRLDEPLTDAEHWPDQLRGMAVKLNGDTTVVNAGRVMRLAGTVAWPVKKDRKTVELTRIVKFPDNHPTALPVEQMAAIFPAIAETVTGDVDTTGVVRATNSLGIPARVTDGRDIYMRNTVVAVLREYIGENGAAPDPQELFDLAWPQYAAGADTDRPGHGPESMKLKIMYALRRFERGEIRGMRTLDEAVETHKARQKPEIVVPTYLPAPNADPGDVFSTLTLDDIYSLPPPSWMIDGILPETGLTFVYGKPGRGKSFFVLDMTLRIAHGMDWHGIKCKQGGVLYIALEGRGGYRNRVYGWHLHHKLDKPSGDFRLLPQSVNMMDEAQVQKLIRTIKGVVGDAKVIVIDTVARSLPGAEENASKEMGLFVAACDAVKEQCGVAVIAVHHSGKDEDRGMRGSSSLEGAGDCIIHFKREDDSEISEVINTKQKEVEKFETFPMRMAKVEWMDGVKMSSTLVPEKIERGTTSERASSMPDRQMCDRIKNALAEAWFKGRPWSIHKAAKTSGRYAPLNIHKEFGVPFKTAEFVLEEWQRNEVVAMVQINSRSAAQGLKVLA